MSHKGRDKHALVIDDNSQNIEILSALLRMEGVRVSSFIEPEFAAAALDNLEGVDLVFCDLEMPRMDGYRLLPALRAHLGAVPVIACSVHTSEIDLVRRRGFDGFLGKPIDGDRFAALLARMLRGVPVWEAS